MDNTRVDRIEDALRGWARGVYTEEAAVELLIRTGWTRRVAFLDDVLVDSEPSGRPWLDWETLGQILDGDRSSSTLAASGGELRVLRLAHSLAAGELGATIAGLDRNAMVLVLAALAHANGSHEHNGPVTQDPVGRVVEQDSGRRLSVALLPSLHPWPTTSIAETSICTAATRPSPTSGQSSAEPRWLGLGRSARLPPAE